MAYNIQINPEYGDASSPISLKIVKDSNKEIRVKVENATHKEILDTFLMSSSDRDIQRTLSLNIPEYSSDSMISIFINIEEKNEDHFDLVKIFPLIYYIDNIVKTISGSLHISPSFVGRDDVCKVSISGKADSRYIVSINDRRFNIIVGDSGIGTIHFKSQDVLEEYSEDIVHKFPIYYYEDGDNYLEKKFSGKYLNVSDHNIKAATDDPRCESYNPLTWDPPEWCLETPPIPEVEPPIPTSPPHEIPNTYCDYDDVDNRPCPCETNSSNIHVDACRLHDASSALMSNGMILNSYTSVDDSISSSNDGYNLQRVFIRKDNSSITTQIIAAKNVAILPKEINEDFTIYITKDIYDRIFAVKEAGRTVTVVFMDEDFQYQGFPVTAIQDAGEYGDFYTAIVDKAISSIQIAETKPCVFSVFYEREVDGSVTPPSLLIPSNIEKLPFVSNPDNSSYLTAVNVSISSNDDYRGPDGESYVHVIAEAIYDRKSQLFYYGFSVGPDSGYTSTNSNDWVKLTTNGNNKNAKTVTDRYNNLHIFWESDRSGLTQIYYGVIGPSAIFYSNSTLSSIVDKKAELDNKEDKPFGYLTQNILEPTGETLERISEQGVIDEYTGVTTYPNKGIIGTSWINNVTNNGQVFVADVDDISDITVSASSLSDTAVAFSKLNRDNFLDLSSGKLSQINYQISFGFEGTITKDISSNSTLLSQSDIEDLYDVFKNQFVLNIDTDLIDNLPFYTLNENKFTIGIENEIYDRFIPIVGSYKNIELQNYNEGDTISSDFTIVAAGDNRSLNHFFVAVIPEKVRFKATNIEDAESFEIRTGDASLYNSNEIQEYYTGRASLAVIYATDNHLFTNKLANVIVRNISKPFVLSETSNIDILVNYSKMFSEDSARYLNITSGVTLDFPRFACSLTIIMDSSVEFSETFIVDLSDKYRSFDIGFGVTSQGSFQSDIFYPYNSSVFEDADVVFNYSDITISSPTYQVNTTVGSIPTYSREQLSLLTYDFYGNEEDTTELFFSNYNLLFDGEVVNPSTGETLGYSPVEIEDPSMGDMFDISTQNPFTLNEFMQVPLTLEGINSNLSIDLDFINNIHLTWQSNREKKWDIYFSCSTNRNIPFRFDTQITNTDSNSLSPDVASDINGKRMIVWHDDRNETFQVFSARALESAISANEVCLNNGLLEYITEETIITEANPTPNSVISFSQANNVDPSGELNLHFRITFYSDAAKQRVVYSSFSLIDNKRWYSKTSIYDNISDSGVVLEPGVSAEIIYVPDVYPQQLFDKQHSLSTGAGVFETPLLSGVKYYVDIESYNIDTAQLTLISSKIFKVDTVDVETNFWRENLDKNNWVCSGQGQDDLLVANNGDKSLFPCVESNRFGYFYIAYQNSVNGGTIISRSFWNTENDILYSSGQGYWEIEGPSAGQKPEIITDQSQSFYIVSTDDTHIYSSNCALPTESDTTVDPSSGSTTEDLCFPGTSVSTVGNLSSITMRVREEDVTGSFVVNRDEVMSVIEKTNIDIDISEVYGAYAVRLRNQDEDWGDWVGIDNSKFIGNGRFIVPWSVPRSNGVKHICCQVLTVYGTTAIQCMDVFVNIETVDYVVKYYSDASRTEDYEVPSKSGFALLATKGETSVTIYVRVVFSEPQFYATGTLKFDVVHQGISNIFNKALDPEESIPTINYIGEFIIRKEDGVYSKDGIGFLKVRFEDALVDECVSDRRDLYNQMLITSELEFLDAVSLSPEESFSENATRVVSKVLDINDFKQYYDADDPNFLFGSPGHYKE